MRYFVFLALVIFIPPAKAEVIKGFNVLRLSQTLHILTDVKYNTNIGLVTTKDGVVLIDPMPGKGRLAELMKLIVKIDRQAPSYILNTHSHEDHSGGNAFFIKQGAKLVGSDFKINEIEGITVNSHTSQDEVFYHKKSNSLFVGDVFDSSWHPTFYAGGLKGFDKAIDHILALGNEDTRIVPGHGKPANKESLREFRKHTHNWVAHIRKLSLKGMGISEIMHDGHTVELLNIFNVENRSPFIPERAYGAN
ncbi:MBL fold metallo-hydrolase [Pseudoalteromonas sp. MMG005]|uniref:MBL fold metallo-hydrolase n=1 Tax=Pseudoalteromonas sp. MMG005 TaxID=2822682 RepID=UPI001B3A5E0F|nr:MBL fold metallo-hydrolase [Pseudoalteromonas sp. MMG005]MBQ4845055.1 MBL fold metallo-hydrolase [Pseudoalteromonas sp. MMG005]